jgi:hypothetical protein
VGLPVATFRRDRVDQMPAGIAYSEGADFDQITRQGALIDLNSILGQELRQLTLRTDLMLLQ